ncbi:DNA-binding transcriptional activator of the SARP family protein [Hartmannibacter diazotrophicus]|uniref:DNA-binding transcriptional activator of the SARP family protein n=1 Tax=Hartmannibacter diazotrophicus TaxID=1482074 RepID=A0A2C9D928_9HYPH|nr:DNA-binding transcriptional activator of the SARP family protein [Hartmannibacter diazotrophicus]
MTALPRLQLFGDAIFRDENGEPVQLPKRAYVLALFLLHLNSQHECDRAKAADLLWPGSPTATVNLRQMLLRIRDAQARAPLFAITQDKIRLLCDEVDCDVCEFNRQIVNVTFQSALEIMDLFGAGPLVDCRRLDTEISEWIYLQDEQMRSALVGEICGLLSRPAANEAPEAAFAIAERLLQICPYEEVAWQVVFKHHAAGGHVHRLEQAYERCTNALRQELDVEPSEETRALYKRLRYPSQAVSKGGPAEVRTSERRPEAKSGIPRLVILPPADMLATQSPLAALAGLMLEDVTVGLCSLRSVSMVAPHTAWRLRETFLESEDSARHYQVDYVLDTSLLTFGEMNRLTVKLFDATSRTILLSDQHELTALSGEQCYRQITRSIILALADAIERAELSRYDEQDNPTAYFWFLQGQKHLRHMDLPRVRRAKKAFRRALDIAPDFAPALSGRSRALRHEWLLMGRGEADLLAEAEGCAVDATQIDRLDARGFREMGLCHLFRSRYDDSLACFDLAEQLSPQHADLILDFAETLVHSSHPDRALSKMDRAIALNPVPPENYWWTAATIYFQMGRYQECIEAVDKMNHPMPALRLAAASWALLGNKAKAEACAQQVLDVYPDFRIEKWLSLISIRSAEDKRHYEQGLRAAGFR